MRARKNKKNKKKVLAGSLHREHRQDIYIIHKIIRKKWVRYLVVIGKMTNFASVIT